MLQACHKREFCPGLSVTEPCRFLFCMRIQSQYFSLVPFLLNWVVQYGYTFSLKIYSGDIKSKLRNSISWEEWLLPSRNLLQNWRLLFSELWFHTKVPMFAYLSQPAKAVQWKCWNCGMWLFDVRISPFHFYQFFWTKQLNKGFLHVKFSEFSENVKCVLFPYLDTGWYELIHDCG